MSKQIFINLPVKDLKKSIDFFTELGFTFNQMFTDDKATCMIIGNDSFAMLLSEKFFSSFTKKEICDTSKSTEVINAISFENREKVDEIMDKALKAGGKEPGKPQDMGYMYSRGFQDLDGHLWEVFYVDMNSFSKS